MSLPDAMVRDDEAELLMRPHQVEELRLDALQPLLAGAYARGMADALDLAGVPAILLDGQGALPPRMPEPLTLSRKAGGRLLLQVRPVAGAGAAPAQLLKALILIGESATFEGGGGWPEGRSGRPCGDRET